MAFKLTKTELSRRDELVEELSQKQDSFEAVMHHLGSDDPSKVNELVTALSVLTVLVKEAEEFRDEIASRLRDEWDDRSEAWQEGDRGSEAEEMVDQWECAEFMEPELGEGDIEDYAQTLEDLPTEV